MKENITVELKSKEALAYDQEQVKEWMDDLVHLIVKNKYEKHNIIDVLDQPIGHDLFWAMSLDEWLKFRGYFSWKDAINLNKKKLEIFGNLEELNTAKTTVYLKTEIDFFNKHHLRFVFDMEDQHGAEKKYEFSVNLNVTKHVSDLTLIQHLRACEFSVHIHG